MSTDEVAAGRRRPLTLDELDRIAAGIREAANTGQLLTNVLHGVYDALLGDDGRSLQTLPDGVWLDATRFAIPATQWHAIMVATGNRATAWGSGPELLLFALELMPSAYVDPSVPAPQLQLPEYRPPVHELHVSREAADVVVACTAHVAALTSYYGADSPIPRRAATSWLHALTSLFLMSFGADTRIDAAGELSLSVHTGSGFVYGIVFHGDRRRCVLCDADLDDDATAHTAGRTPDRGPHEHVPSFPFDAPLPGQWLSHS